MSGPVLLAGRYSVRLRVRPLVVGALLFVATVGFGVLTMNSGDYPVPPGDVLRAVLGETDPATDFVVNQLRLPRLLTCALVGVAMAGSGAVFQDVIGNPLGSPDLMGFVSGAATGGIVATILFHGTPGQVALGALVGGFGTALVTYLLSWKRGVQGYRLILVGIGTGAAISAWNAYLISKATFADAAAAFAWLVGSVAGRGWGHVTALAVSLAVLVPVLLLIGPQLRVLELGDDAAAGLGIRVQRVRLIALAGGVGLCAAATAAAGPIAFVGLAAPQLARRLTRAAGPNLLPSMGMGALLMVSADLAGQRLFAPRQIPVGVVTAVLGGLYLMWLLGWLRRRRLAIEI